MAITIAIYNRKGGVGKTHATANLTGAFALMGNRVLAIDADSQVNLTRYLLQSSSVFDEFQNIKESVSTIYDVLNGTTNVYNAIENVSLSKKRRFPSMKKSNTSSSYHFKNISCTYDVMIGSKELDFLELNNTTLFKEQTDLLNDNYDIILVDFSPSLDDATLMFLAGCDYIISPVECGNNDSIAGYTDILNSIDILKEGDVNPNLESLGFFYTNVRDYRASQKEMYEESLRIKDDLNLIKTYIRQDYASTEKSRTLGQPICVCLPTSKAGKDYIALAKEIKQKLNSDRRVIK